MLSYQHVIASANLEMTLTRVPENPNMTDDKWSKTARHWHVRLLSRREKPPAMTLYFSQGSAHTKAPTLEEILDCLASDASSVAGSSFEDWAAELGYDPDSRKAEATFKFCQEQAAKLKKLLGRALYDDLLFKVERL